MSPFNKELLEILACPACKSKVRLESDRLICTNSPCGLQYPIREGIPVMLIEEAARPNNGGSAESWRKKPR